MVSFYSDAGQFSDTEKLISNCFDHAAMRIIFDYVRFDNEPRVYQLLSNRFSFVRLDSTQSLLR